MFVFIATIFLLIISQGQCMMQATANVLLHGTSTSIGTITFVQNDANSPVQVSGMLMIQNGNNTTHGFHVHSLPVDENYPNCTAALGHFNPYNTSHGPREATIFHRHVGDLGNLTADANGMINISFSDNIIQLYYAPQSIAGRTIVLHQMPDDGGNTGMGESNTTGNAGARLGCGLIKMTSAGLNIQPTIPVSLLTMIITFFIVFSR